MNLNPTFSSPLKVSSSRTTLYGAGLISMYPLSRPSVIIPPRWILYQKESQTQGWYYIWYLDNAKPLEFSFCKQNLHGFTDKSTIFEELFVHDSKFDVGQLLPLRHWEIENKLLVPQCIVIITCFHKRTKNVSIYTFGSEWK